MVKLFRGSVSPQRVEYEAAINRAVHAAGLPAPAVRDVVDVGGRLGIVFDRVDGLSMLTVLRSKPWRLFALADLLARLHLQMHAAPAIPLLPPLKQRLRRTIGELYVPAQWESVRDVVLDRLEALPDGDTVCHGDFHPDNVILTNRGPIIIDWVDAARGPAVADVARTVLLAQIAELPADMPGRRIINAVRGWFLARYLTRYRQGRRIDQDLLNAWIRVRAAARMSEGLTTELPRLLQLAEGATEQRNGGSARS